MASETLVRDYLAGWFHLGRSVVNFRTGDRHRPTTIFTLGRYSNDFETCWTTLKRNNLNAFHLEGTPHSLADLLTPAWDISPCARCGMFTPLPCAGLPSTNCSCNGLGNWPNFDLPIPRPPLPGPGRGIANLQLMHRDLA